MRLLRSIDSRRGKAAAALFTLPLSQVRMKHVHVDSMLTDPKRSDPLRSESHALTEQRGGVVRDDPRQHV